MSDVDLMRRIERMNIGDSTLFEDHVRELVNATTELLGETLPISQADLQRFQRLEAAVLKFTREA